VCFVCKLVASISDEPAGVPGEEGGHDDEHGVTEAADVQEGAAVRSLGRGVRLHVDADELGASPAVIVRPGVAASVACLRLALFSCDDELSDRRVEATVAPTAERLQAASDGPLRLALF